MSVFTNVTWGWIGRRLLDWGGWIGTTGMAVYGFYAALPPVAQDIVLRILTNRWQDITLGALLPALVLIVSQFMSYRATVRDHVVADGKKAPLPDVLAGLPKGTKTLIEQKVETIAARKKPNLIERWFGK